MVGTTPREILDFFLNIPIGDGSRILELFSTLPGAVVGRGKAPLERYVFIPGNREDALVLVAHVDTVWDAAYGYSAQTTAVFKDGVFSGTDPSCGIGADDRAGCAMLWALRDSGHSLLLVDGEEHGKRGAKYLRRNDPKLLRRLNRHRFMLELDWKGTNCCLYNQVENTQAFKDYISEQLGFQDSREKGGCDLQVLCRKVCGVNIGVGYHGWHRPGETLVLSEWENTLCCLTDFLEKAHPRFPIPWHAQLKTLLLRIKAKLNGLLRKK